MTAPAYRAVPATGLPGTEAMRRPAGAPRPLLPRIRDYLREHRRATLGDLALHFDMEPDAMRGMLEVWVRKGRVRILSFAATCNTSCPVACDDAAMTIYEWSDERAHSPASRPGFTSLPLMQDGSACRHGSCG